uniref:BLOC-1-related complex subunit 7 n=1 Tax=Panagrellus redivivus TaxID=6233 RepID=A0A7E4VD64_PANRE
MNTVLRGKNRSSDQRLSLNRSPHESDSTADSTVTSNQVVCKESRTPTLLLNKALSIERDFSQSIRTVNGAMTTYMKHAVFGPPDTGMPK